MDAADHRASGDADPHQLIRVNAGVRRRQIQSRAHELGLDGVLAYGWRRGLVVGLSGYFPGYVTNTASVWIPADGEPVLGVRFPFEQGPAHQRSTMNTIHAVSPDACVPQPVSRIGLLCGDTGMDETPRGLVAELERAGLTVQDLSRWFDGCREVKTPDEIEGLRRAAQLGSDALTAAAEVARSGCTDFTIVAHIEAHARRHGASRADCLIGVGTGAVVTEAHGRVLGVGEAVGLELNMVYGGYFAHVQATIIPAEADAVYRRAVRIARQARAAVIAELRPGARVAIAVEAGDEVLRSHDLLSFKEYDFGHGIGWDTPEHPRLLPGSDRVVQADAVIAVHCGLRRPDGETAYTGGPVHVGEFATTELVADPVVVVQPV
jgi:Xaa-Pro aminopeptidase